MQNICRPVLCPDLLWSVLSSISLNLNQAQIYVCSLNLNTIFPQEMLRVCGGRVLLFDNKPSEEMQQHKQIAELFDTVDSLIARNGGKPFSNHLFAQIQVINFSCTFYLPPILIFYFSCLQPMHWFLYPNLQEMNARKEELCAEEHSAEQNLTSQKEIYDGYLIQIANMVIYYTMHNFNL